MSDGPPRGGTRGGRDQFNWSDVKNDKYRECYLGHSVKASTGRWQERKDIFWYNKSGSSLGLDEDLAALQRERDEVKAREQEMMREALGLAPQPREEPRIQPGAAPAGSGPASAGGGLLLEGGERTLADVWKHGPDAGALARPPPVADASRRGDGGAGGGADGGSSSDSSGSSSGSRHARKNKRKHRSSDKHGERGRGDKEGVGLRDGKRERRHASDKERRRKKSKRHKSKKRESERQ
jgi:hypothetical protein